MLCVFDSFSQPYITSYTKFEICVTAETRKTRGTFKETSHQNNQKLSKSRAVVLCFNRTRQSVLNV